MKINKNKGFTLIELLAVILILGIIALIAIPTVNNILKESRTGAWKSTASQMAKAVENYYQLQVIKNAPYMTDFKAGVASNGTLVAAATAPTGVEKVVKVGSNYVYISSTGTGASAPERYAYLLDCLSLKGDIPKEGEIDVLKLDDNGASQLAFSNSNASCMTTNASTFTAGEYTSKTGIAFGGNIVCISK
ncbi:MAG: prepilin-type N-terminal cleavage/methylation domain-containing protein [Bacilli bacterium]